MPEPDKKTPFLEEVFPAELREIDVRRSRLELPGTGEATGPTTDHALVGLSLSGGGLRSATFSLGVIQALARHGLLRRVDYLSTVSGGGFLGACLSSVLNDPGVSTDSNRFPLRYQVGEPEPMAVGQLRQGAHYLAPGGILHKLRIPALMLRGVLSNLLIFLFLILVSVLATEAIYELGSHFRLRFGHVVLAALASFLLLVLGLPLVQRLLHRRSTWKRRDREEIVFTVILFVLLSIVALTAAVILLDQWIDGSWLDVKASVTANLLRPFEPRDYPQWIIIFGLLVLFMISGRLSAHLGRMSGRIALIGVGLLGPMVLVVIYLALLPMQIDSPFVSPRSLFSLDDRHALGLDEMDQVSPGLVEQFRSNRVTLGKSAQISTLEEDLRWLVHDGERAYTLFREQSGVAVYPDYQYLLNRGIIPAELGSILASKGFRLGPSSGATLEARENRFVISGSHEYWIEREADGSGWMLQQLVSARILAEALQKLSYTLSISEATADILLHENVDLSDDDLAQAIRFVEQFNPRDVILLIDNSVPPFEELEEFRRVFRTTLVRVLDRLNPTMRMAVFWFDEHVYESGGLSPLTARRKAELRAQLFGEGPDEVPRLNFRGARSNLPAALQRAIRELREHSHGEVRRAIILISDGRVDLGADGSDAGLHDWIKREFAVDATDANTRVHGIALSKDARFDLFASLTRGTGGTFYPVFESQTGERFRDLLDAVEKIREAAGAHLGPAFERLEVTDRSREVRYTLTQARQGVHLEATVPAPGPSAADLDDDPDWWRSLLHDAGIDLGERPRLTRVDENRWKVLDPYRYTVRRIGRQLKVEEAPPLQGEDADRWSLTSTGIWDGRTDWVYLATLAILALYWFTVDINRSAVHGFYRDRLSKAYLFRVDGNGALEHLDRQCLSDLNGPGSVAPYHLINVALNLQGSREPGLRGRVSDFFIFSKHFTGSARTGYVSTRELEQYDRNLDLASAMAISGAAAAPNAGATTIRPLVFIMTLLNLRLGYWLPNPAGITDSSWLSRLSLWRGPGPKYVLKESLGQMGARGRYVNVSDGGHIENLGVYELLRRRCKVIIAVDGERDSDMRFEGLVQLMIYARIDLGVLIEMDLEGLRLDDRGSSRQHWALGAIRYADGEMGSLVYIKTSVTGDEYEYIRKYRLENPGFPHESTAIQFFGESQFEAYRGLGYHAGDQVMNESDILEDLLHRRDRQEGA